MKDHYGRRVNYMRISITDLCNLRCVYCMPEAGIPKRIQTQNLSFESIEELVREGVELGIDKIRLTGGEPLVRRGVIDLVARIGQIPGIRDFAMTTNGILLPKMAQELKNAGLKRLNISLDTLNGEKYRKITRWGELSDVLDGIRAAHDVGFEPLKINTVLIKGFNEDEIEDFVNLTKIYGVETRFIELMPLGDSTAYAFGRYLKNDTVLERIPELEPIESLEYCGPAKRYRLPGALGTVGLINPISHLFCSDCNRIRVTTDGKIKPCLHSDAEIDIYQLQKEGLSIKEILKRAIEAKPERHHIDTNETITNRNMNEIGG